MLLAVRLQNAKLFFEADQRAGVAGRCGGGWTSRSTGFEPSASEFILGAAAMIAATRSAALAQMMPSAGRSAGSIAQLSEPFLDNHLDDLSAVFLESLRRISDERAAAGAESNDGSLPRIAVPT
jgi:hypothetical protein